MASSSSSNSREKRRAGILCKCGLPASMLTSNTRINSGRRFWRCRNWMREVSDCHYFARVREDDNMNVEEESYDLGGCGDDKQMCKLVAAIEDVKLLQRELLLKFLASEGRKIGVMNCLYKFMLFSFVVGIVLGLLLGKLMFYV